MQSNILKVPFEPCFWFQVPLASLRCGDVDTQIKKLNRVDFQTVQRDVDAELCLTDLELVTAK